MPERRKSEQLSFLLPVFGAILMLPPLIGVFQIDMVLFGVPLSVVYLFGLWFVLIVATALMSQRLGRYPGAGGTDSVTDEDSDT